MRVDRNQIEIMSPVGSYESLTAAIQAGATSIYFGAGNLNMRSQSSVNFTPDDLTIIVQRCKEYNIRAYLTLNTVMYDEEIEQLKIILDRAAEVGVSAVIASDQAAIQLAVERGLEVHMSTQVNISNTAAVKYFSRFADVLVLARELNLEQVQAIHKAILNENIRGPKGELIKLEMFVHGALCMAVSGKCYLSLHEANHSANRGKCIQICRRGYTVTDKETDEQLDIDNEYIMSPMDLCTIHFLNKILDAGVSVLKIEGRARGPEYVKTVTQCYHEAVDSIFDGSYNEEKIIAWQVRLSTVFNRGFWNGYYLGQRLGEWTNIYGNKATRRKEYLGKVTHYFTKSKVGEISIETGSISVGDTVLITGPSTGVIEIEVNELRVNLNPVQSAIKGEICSLAVPEYLRLSDKVYKWVNVEE